MPHNVSGKKNFKKSELNVKLYENKMLCKTEMKQSSKAFVLFVINFAKEILKECV